MEEIEELKKEIEGLKNIISRNSIESKILYNRLDGYLAREKHERAYALIREYLEFNWVKANTWFATPNPHLGGLTPNVMIEAGRVDKLLAFIEVALDENKR